MAYEETETGILVKEKPNNQTSDNQRAESSDESIGSFLRSELGDPQKDPLFNQNFVRSKSMDLKQRELDAIMDSSWIAERVVDVYAEHATKNGAEIDVKENDAVNEELSNEIETRVNDWINSSPVMNTLQSLIEKERYSGIGVLLPVTVERGPEDERTWDTELTNGLVEVSTFNAVSDKYVNDIEFNKNTLSPDFEDLESLNIDYKTDGVTYTQTIHPSRAKVLRSRPSQTNEDEGLSVFRRMAMVLKSFLNSEWSVGQIVYRMVFKVLKTDLGEFDSRKQKQIAERMLEKELNALSMAMIDEDEELNFAGSSKGAQGIGPILDFLKELLSASSQTPKSILFGQQQGEVTGSEKDQQNYYNRIESYQDIHLTPILKYMVGLKLRAARSRLIPRDENDRRVVSPSRIEYECNWNPIFERSRKEKAETERLEAETERLKTQTVTAKLRTGLITAEQANIELESEDVSPSCVSEARSIRESALDRFDTEDLDRWELRPDDSTEAAGPSS